MRKALKTLWVVCLFVAFLWTVQLLQDRNALKTQLIRLHVVANSDSPEDQDIKLQVRDAILNSLQEDLQNACSMEEARAYIQQNLPKLEALANQVLSEAGFSERASVSLGEEAYPIRDYDTFRLPSGVYESLRVLIGEAEGHNWWCVVFPQLCVPATSEDFSEKAASSGFSEELTDTISKEKSYELRFYLLDLLGRVENLWFQKG